MLQTEVPPHLPLNRKLTGSGDAPTYSRTMSSPTDSDEDSNVSPPREILPVPAVSVLSQDYVLRLPTRWSDQFRHHGLSVSADGRDLTYQGSWFSLSH